MRVELFPTAGHEPRSRDELDDRVEQNIGSNLRDDVSIDANLAGEDEGLRLGARFRQAPFREKEVQPLTRSVG